MAPTAAVATKFICNIALDRDMERVAGASDTEVVDLFASQIAAAVVWGGEVVKRLTRAQREANDHRQLFLEAMELKLVAERTARATEEEAMRAELEVALEGRTVAEDELEEVRARAAEEVEGMKVEVANAQVLWKEDFLRSLEFDRLCMKKSVAYFKSGFDGAVAQFRAHGYPEEKHPAPFLDMKKALREMPDEEEKAEEEEEEEEVSGDESPPQDEDVPPSPLNEL
ncbi:hypothetical protein F511_10254 [Dorcoceras hygrometricum]|uniref:Uncharacterized protein n=1 Tax=Dorcoceras hygrometricum TaxID=472368 RepID=A0A2Z7AGW5_9LAMI|nr:hypothetical protein F511_10254 [Dorcoceras hygrometricum]